MDSRRTRGPFGSIIMLRRHDSKRMAITSVRAAHSPTYVAGSRANSPTRYELPEVSRHGNSRRYRFSRLSVVQVHGATKEIKLSHYRRPATSDRRRVLG